MKYFKGTFLRNKINTINESDPDVHTNNIKQTYIKLANDRDFFAELKELFPSKLIPRSDTKQWRPKQINEKPSPRKDKPKLLRKNEIKGKDESKLN